MTWIIRHTEDVHLGIPAAESYPEPYSKQSGACFPGDGRSPGAPGGNLPVAGGGFGYLFLGGSSPNVSQPTNPILPVGFVVPNVDPDEAQYLFRPSAA
jgi:hypothetical protein